MHFGIEVGSLLKTLPRLIPKIERKCRAGTPGKIVIDAEAGGRGVSDLASQVVGADQD